MERIFMKIISGMYFLDKITRQKVHSKQYWFFKNTFSTITMQSQENPASWFSWSCMVIVLKSSF